MLHRNLRGRSGGGGKNPESTNNYTKFDQLNIKKIIKIIATKVDSQHLFVSPSVRSFVRLCLRWRLTLSCSLCISQLGQLSLPSLRM